MKIIKLSFVMVLFIILSSCQKEDEIVMNGEVIFDLPVYEKFVDPGINIPEDYTILYFGEVNSNVVGEYLINYRVLDENGVIAKEMTRIVNVIDMIPPEISINNNSTIYIGMYDEFLDCYVIEDNYYENDKLEVTYDLDINTIIDPGSYLIKITVTDPSNNSASAQIEVAIVLDYLHLISNLEVPTSDVRSKDNFSEDWYEIVFYDNGYLNIDKNGNFVYSNGYDTQSGRIFFIIRGTLREMKITHFLIEVKKYSTSDPSRLVVIDFDASIVHDEIDLSNGEITNRGPYDDTELISIFNEQGLFVIEKFQYIVTEILGLNFVN